MRKQPEYFIALQALLNKELTNSWVFKYDVSTDKIILLNLADKKKENRLFIWHDGKKWFTSNGRDTRDTFCIGQAIHILNTFAQIVEIHLKIYDKRFDK